jgi:hypothetical protein
LGKKNIKIEEVGKIPNIGNKNEKFEVLTAVAAKKFCLLGYDGRFGRTCCLHLQVQRIS